jgi:hypothetical protein
MLIGILPVQRQMTLRKTGADISVRAEIRHEDLLNRGAKCYSYTSLLVILPVVTVVCIVTTETRVVWVTNEFGIVKEYK